MKRLGRLLAKGLPFWASWALVTLFLLARGGLRVVFEDGIWIRPGAWVSDVLVTYWPNLHDMRVAWLRDGALLFWRDRMFGGWTILGDPQGGWGYGFWFLVLGLDVGVVLGLSVWLHAVLALWGTHLLARAANLEAPGYWLLLTGMALNPRFYGQAGLGHLSLVQAAAYVPFALAAAYHMHRGERKWAAVLGVVLGAQVVNHVQMALYTGLVVLVFLVWRWWYGYMATRNPLPSHRPFLFPKKLGLDLFAAGALTFLLAGPFLIPLLQNRPYLARQPFSPQEVAVGALHLRDLLTLLVPHYRGYADTLLYLGLPLFTLVWHGRREPETRLALVLTWLALGYALLPSWETGAHLVSRIPLLNQVRGAGRVWLVVYPLLLLAAARGLERALHTPPVRPRLPWAEGLLTGLGMLIAGYWMRFGPPPAYLPGLLLAGLLAWLVIRWVLPHPHLTASAKTGLTLLAIVLDLGLMAGSLIEARPLPTFFDRPHLVDFLQEAREHYGRFRTYSPSYSLPQHLAAAYGLETADGVDPLYPALYDRFLHMAAGVNRPRYSVTVPYLHDPGPGPILRANREAMPRPCLLGLANVRYLLAPFPLPQQEPRFVFVDSMDGVWVYENRCFLPRAFLVGRTEPVQSPHQALAWVGRHAEQATTKAAVVDGKSLAAPVQGAVVWKVYRANRRMLEVETSREAFLMLSMNYHPAWRAWLDGQPVRLYQANGPFMGIYLPPGKHRVELAFRPWSLIWGWLAHGLGLGLVFWWWKREGRRGNGSAFPQ